MLRLCLKARRFHAQSRVSLGKMVMRALLCCLLCLAAQLHGGAAVTSGNADGMERWGYVTVRPKAHIFWWYYKSPKQGSSLGKPWPTILWMQGDLGESGSGHGNFLGIGPLDTNMNPRNSTWLHKANLLFVDHPVGVGYSYVDDESALAKTQLQAALDLVELFKVLPKEIPTLQSSPLYLVGRPFSYGGKMAAMIAGSLNLTLGGIPSTQNTQQIGVVLGDDSISPDDFL